MRSAVHFFVLTLLPLLFGCSRGPGSIDRTIQRSTAIYVARQIDDHYVIAEIIRAPANNWGTLRIGDVATSRANIIKTPHPSTPEIVILVYRDNSATGEPRDFGQIESPLRDGRLATWNITLDELRQRAAAAPSRSG